MCAQAQMVGLSPAHQAQVIAQQALLAQQVSQWAAWRWSGA
jgi:hypothetical protein